MAHLSRYTYKRHALRLPSSWWDFHESSTKKAFSYPFNLCFFLRGSQQKRKYSFVMWVCILFIFCAEKTLFDIFAHLIPNVRCFYYCLLSSSSDFYILRDNGYTYFFREWGNFYCFFIEKKKMEVFPWYCILWFFFILRWHICVSVQLWTNWQFERRKERNSREDGLARLGRLVWMRIAKLNIKKEKSDKI